MKQRMDSTARAALNFWSLAEGCFSAATRSLASCLRVRPKAANFLYSSLRAARSSERADGG